MKIKSFLFLITVTLFGFTYQLRAQEVEHPVMLEVAFSRLKSLTVVSSSSVGFGSAPGEFFKLSKYFLQYGDVEYFRGLLEDEKPIVRVMGLVCLAQSMKAEEFVEVAKLHEEDRQEVDYMIGCILSRTSVSKIAQKLSENRCYFGCRSGECCEIINLYPPPNNSLNRSAKVHVNLKLVHTLDNATKMMSQH